MRHLLARAALCLALGLATGLAAADPFSGLQFTDGKERGPDSFKGQTTVVVYFCGHCPSAAEFLGTDGKAIHDWIEQEKLPVTLVLATPEFKPDRLKELDQERGYGMTAALYAYDPLNRENISLKNIFQCRLVRPDGRVELMSFQGTAGEVKQMVNAQNAGAYHYSPDGITDAQVKELWWAVERGHPQAIKNLATVGKSKKSPQATALLERVQAACATRQAAVVAAAPSMAAVEALEAFMTEAEGLDLKPAQARYKELKAMKDLKDELKARDIYQQCHQMLASPKTDQQKNGKEALAMLAKKFPSTVYGAKAADESR